MRAGRWPGVWAAALGAAWAAMACAQTPGAPSPGAPTPARETLADVRKRLDAAWTRGDLGGIHAALDAAWDLDTRWARESSYRLAAGESVVHRPIGAVLLARHADARALAQAARALDPSQFRDERRLIVRALGGKDAQAAGPLARRFLDDPDDMVRVAAILALADLGDPGSVGLFVRQLPRAPAETVSWDDDERSIRAFALHGAAQHLSGVRATSARAVSDWWREGGTPVAPPELAPDRYETGVTRGERYFISPSFDVYLRVAGVQEPAPDGPLAWGELRPALEDAADRARRAAARVFGPVRLPVIRAVICDDQQFTPHAGNSFMGGVSNGNEIVLRLQRPRVLAGVITHEMIHVIHGAAYTDQPRWLSEGIAQSLTRSPDASVWTAGGRPEGLEDLIRTGAVSEIIGWSSGASSGAAESRRYTLAFVVVDYLRFGGFAPGDERLCWLMGALSRGAAARQALESIYGAPLRQLDRGLAEWLLGRAP